MERNVLAFSTLHFEKERFSIFLVRKLVFPVLCTAHTFERIQEKITIAVWSFKRVEDVRTISGVLGFEHTCRWRCSLPNRCCHQAPPQPSWCNQKADHWKEYVNFMIAIAMLHYIHQNQYNKITMMNLGQLQAPSWCISLPPSHQADRPRVPPSAIWSMSN